jgi:hypothetical protein
MVTGMPAHRLTRTFAVFPDIAREELRNVLNSVEGDVRSASEQLQVTEKQVHTWITAWGIRAWLEEKWPASRRIAEGQRRRREKIDPKTNKDLA